MCVVHILGPEIDTMMVYNERKELVLIAGNMGWKLVPEKLSLQLSIDGSTAIPQEPRTNASGHLVEILLGDGETLHRLRNADMLEWIMPEGHFRGPVSGFGVALDALTKCQRG
ncbi:MAG TPA: hypothetical protein DIW86_15620 [Pseudomonas sp.]|nr:hypothetical protein [Pseudomonas sp.]